jgi:hypothetical protein
MDDADRSEPRLAEETAREVARIRAEASAARVFEECRNCGEDLPAARRRAGFCDADCRDDWQRRERARLRNEGRDGGRG